MTTPIALLSQATKAVPAIKYATGVVGVAAALFLVRGLLPDVGIVAMLPILIGSIVVMAVLVIFAASVSAPSVKKNLLAIVFLWAACVFVITFMVFTVTAVAFGWPTAWSRLILPRAASETSLIDVGPPDAKQVSPAVKTPTENPSNLPVITTPFPEPSYTKWTKTPQSQNFPQGVVCPCAGTSIRPMPYPTPFPDRSILQIVNQCTGDIKVFVTKDQPHPITPIRTERFDTESTVFPGEDKSFSVAGAVSFNWFVTQCLNGQ